MLESTKIMFCFRIKKGNFHPFSSTSLKASHLLATHKHELTHAPTNTHTPTVALTHTITVPLHKHTRQPTTSTLQAHPPTRAHAHPHTHSFILPHTHARTRGESKTELFDITFYRSCLATADKATSKQSFNSHLSSLAIIFKLSFLVKNSTTFKEIYKTFQAETDFS